MFNQIKLFSFGVTISITKLASEILVRLPEIFQVACDIIARMYMLWLIIDMYDLKIP